MNSKKKLSLKKIDVSQLNAIQGGINITVVYSHTPHCRLTIDNPTVVETCHKSFNILECAGLTDDIFISY